MDDDDVLAVPCIEITIYRNSQDHKVVIREYKRTYVDDDEEQNVFEVLDVPSKGLTIVRIIRDACFDMNIFSNILGQVASYVIISKYFVGGEVIDKDAKVIDRVTKLAHSFLTSVIRHIKRFLGS